MVKKTNIFLEANLGAGKQIYDIADPVLPSMVVRKWMDAHGINPYGQNLILELIGRKQEAGLITVGRDEMERHARLREKVGKMLPVREVREDAELISWDQVARFVEVVAAYFSGARFDGVLGIPRGGIVLATMLSYRLGVPLVYGPCRYTLVVDDIADTGQTLSHYAHSPACEVVALAYHKQSEVLPSIWLVEKTDRWLQFPWE